MAWIESHQSLPNHPKTKRLRRLLKINGVEATGYLHYFWWWAMTHAQDGVLDRYTAADIADACEWESDEEQFLSALIESGFIDKTDSGMVIHDWYDYAGKMIELRKKDAERKRKSRGKTEESEGSPKGVQGMSEGNPTESIRNPNPNPNPNKDNKEKRFIKKDDAFIQGQIEKFRDSPSVEGRLNLLVKLSGTIFPGNDRKEVFANSAKARSEFHSFVDGASLVSDKDRRLGTMFSIMLQTEDHMTPWDVVTAAKKKLGVS